MKEESDKRVEIIASVVEEIEAWIRDRIEPPSDLVLRQWSTQLRGELEQDKMGKSDLAADVLKIADWAESKTRQSTPPPGDQILESVLRQLRVALEQGTRPSKHFSDEAVATGTFPAHNGPAGPVYDKPLPKPEDGELLPCDQCGTSCEVVDGEYMPVPAETHRSDAVGEVERELRRRAAKSVETGIPVNTWILYELADKLAGSATTEECDCGGHCEKCIGVVEHRYCRPCYQIMMAEAVAAGKHFGRRDAAALQTDTSATTEPHPEESCSNCGGAGWVINSCAGDRVKCDSCGLDQPPNVVNHVTLANRIAALNTPERRLIEQLCSDLNGAHNEICKLQGIDPAEFDWPEWTPQANSIRAAETLLRKRLAKTEQWTMYPNVAGLADRMERCAYGGASAVKLNRQLREFANELRRIQPQPAKVPAKIEVCVPRGGCIAPIVKVAGHGGPDRIPAGWTWWTVPVHGAVEGECEDTKYGVSKDQIRVATEKLKKKNLVKIKQILAERDQALADLKTEREARKADYRGAWEHGWEEAQNAYNVKVEKLDQLYEAEREAHQTTKAKMQTDRAATKKAVQDMQQQRDAALTECSRLVKRVGELEVESIKAPARVWIGKNTNGVIVGVQVNEPRPDVSYVKTPTLIYDMEKNVMWHRHEVTQQKQEPDDKNTINTSMKCQCGRPMKRQGPWYVCIKCVRYIPIEDKNE